MAFCDTRETKDGRQVVHFRPTKHLLSDAAFGPIGLNGSDPEELWQIMCFPYRAFLQDGTAPMGPNEREIAKLT